MPPTTAPPTNSSAGSKPNWEEQQSSHCPEIEFQGFDVSDPTPKDDDDLEDHNLDPDCNENFQQGIGLEWEPDKAFRKRSCC